ncbi:MAG: hypothetical protein ACTTJS_07135 [Wolinella sp.]
MKAKRFTIFWLLFSIATGLYVYSFNADSYTFNPPFSTTQVTLLVAIWILIPLAIFFLLSLALMTLGKFSCMLSEYHDKKDYELFLQQILFQGIGREFKAVFKTTRFRHLSGILRRFNLTPNTQSTLSNESEIDALIEASAKIKSGEVVELRRFHVEQNSALNIKNQLNRLKNDPKSALEIVKKQDTPELLRHEAICELIKNGEEKEVRKYQKSIPIDREIVNTLIDSYKDKKISLTHEEIVNFTSEAGFMAKDYLDLARTLKGILEPDSWLKLFEMLADSSDIAEEAYLYVLIELEMIERANERLATCAKDDFLKVRALLELRKIGSIYPAELFFF